VLDKKIEDLRHVVKGHTHLYREQGEAAMKKLEGYFSDKSIAGDSNKKPQASIYSLSTP